ncbi:hypothetical protein T06_10076 [Trichinella sp. T6]|nr:hypothetical protein T06_10076 [Trichinella sp. T6]
MLLATAFLPVPQVDTGVSLLEAGTTDWMTDKELPLWNVHNKVGIIGSTEKRVKVITGCMNCSRS